MEERNTAPAAGIPYEEIRWFNIEGQPFGAAVHFNVMALRDGDNIVDVEGAMAVGGSFTSYRGASIAFGHGGSRTGVGYSPDLVRCLVGENLSAAGPFNVVGQVVAGGSVSVGVGSSYLIGRSGAPDQAAVLAELYANSSGSRYWIPAEYQDHFVISSYDVPRWIPAERIGADLTAFFSDAEVSLREQWERLLSLPVTGETIAADGEWTLRGGNINQNVFLIDATAEGGNLTRQMRLEIPDESVAVVKVRTGPAARVQFGIWGRTATAARTLYLFEDAKDLAMDVPAGIWGSILAPQLALHAHRTGGNINGNVVLRSFHVEAGSGFEFHWYPFTGRVTAGAEAALPDVILPPTPPVAEQPVPGIPEPPRPRPPMIEQPVPGIPEPPRPRPPMIEQPVPGIPEPPRPRPPMIEQPVPGIPEPPRPRPPMIEQPVPGIPEPPRPRPPMIEQPVPGIPEPPRPRPPIVEQPVQGIPEPPRPRPPMIEQPVPGIPEPPVCPECPVISGVISGCICDCICSCVGCCVARCLPHLWEVRLYWIQGKARWPVARAVVPCCGSFRFEVPVDGAYCLKCYPSAFTGNDCRCRPRILLKNVGVSSLILG